MPSSSQGAEGESLGGRPIDRGALGDHLAATLQERDQLGVYREVRGHRAHPVGREREPLDGHGRVRRLLGLASAEASPGPSRLVGLVGLGRPRLDHRQSLLELVAQILFDASDVVLGEEAELEQLVGVQPSYRLLVSNLLVHQRLRVARFVALVVTVASIADEIDEHVLAEALPIRKREPRAVHHGLRIVPIHVEDGDLDHLGDVGAVEGRACLGGSRGEADLVVHHDVHGAARRVAIQVAEVERLGHDALSRERGVSVQKDGDDAAPIGVPSAYLLGSRAALDDGVHGLEMRGVRGEREMDTMSFPCASVTREALVVFDVAGPERTFEQGRILELAEDGLEGLAENVREDVEAAAVSHAEDELTYTFGGPLLDECIEQRDERFGAFQGEALLPDELGVDEPLEELGG